MWFGRGEISQSGIGLSAQTQHYRRGAGRRHDGKQATRCNI